ncbi:hypothetical protein STEG23_033358, partial [Scotinomys teguina]
LSKEFLNDTTGDSEIHLWLFFLKMLKVLWLIEGSGCAKSRFLCRDSSYACVGSRGMNVCAYRGMSQVYRTVIHGILVITIMSITFRCIYLIGSMLFSCPFRRRTLQKTYILSSTCCVNFGQIATESPTEVLNDKRNGVELTMSSTQKGCAG